MQEELISDINSNSSLYLTFHRELLRKLSAPVRAPSCLIELYVNVGCILRVWVPNTSGHTDEKAEVRATA
jgi:hypothetical protein